MTRYRTLDDLQPAGARVLVRVDLNVPLHDGVVTDHTRIERAAQTLLELADAGAIVIALSHFGRPKGKPDATLSLSQITSAMMQVIGRKVTFVETDWTDTSYEAMISTASAGDILLMENTRFHAGEEANDPDFARQLAKLGDIYVNDAFSAAHRAHASTEAIARLLPSAAGRAMQAELEALEKALTTPQRPVTAVVGGAKISSKLELLGSLCEKVDTLIIGGGMANTFLAAQGVSIGASLCENDLLDTARAIMSKAEDIGCHIVLPSDVVVAREFKANADHRTASRDDVGSDEMILDAGPQAVAEITQIFEASKTLVWNGPLGAFEIAPFDQATTAAARAAAALTKAGKLLSVAGGGDTVSALSNAGAEDGFSYISTAGGAFLEWLEGKPLPGVKVLENDTLTTTDTTLREAG